jgi:hypothetical protein
MVKKDSEATIIKESDRNVAKAEASRRELATKFRDEEKVPVSISPLYKPYFGNVMTVSINGISCAIPVDGKTYTVPKSFAEEVEIRKFRQDALFEKSKKLSDVQNNFETSPGELALF